MFNPVIPKLMSESTQDDNEKKSGASWLQIAKAILTGLITVLTALGVTGSNL